MRNKAVLMIFVVLAGLLAFKALVFLDPDMGWRVVAGQHYLSSGIIKSDIYSYTMGGFAWVDHAWLVTLFIGLFQPLFSGKLLALIFTTVAVCGIFLVYASGRGFKIKNSKGVYDLSIIPLLCLSSILFLFFGIRAQVFSWLMLAVLLLFVQKKSENSKIILLLPPFFLVWANLHGSFVMGLTIWGIMLLAKTVRTRKINTLEVVATVISAFVTLLNPYGIGVWKEVASSVFDNSLRSRIVEWMPALSLPNFVMVYYIAFSSTFIYLQRKKIKLEWILVYIFLLIEAMLSRRHLPLWAIVSFYPTTGALHYFYRDINKIKFGKKRFVVFYKALLLMALIFIWIQTALGIGGTVDISEKKFYPKEALNYLRSSNVSGEIFTDYGWGGYSLWKYPEKKVFIDGRMPSWKDENGYKAMDEYVDILEGKLAFNTVANKYNISSVLLPKRLKTKNTTFEIKGRLKTILEVIGIKTNNFEFVEEIKKDGWVVVYEDDVSLLFQKGNNSKN